MFRDTAAGPLTVHVLYYATIGGLTLRVIKELIKVNLIIGSKKRKPYRPIKITLAVADGFVGYNSTSVITPVITPLNLNGF